MEVGGLLLIGLLFATGTSISNVLTDVARKKTLDKHEIIAASVCVKLFAALAYTLIFIWRVNTQGPVEIRDSGPLFGIAALTVSPFVTFLVYLVIDMTGVAAATLLYFRALQVSPISLALPFIAFTPLFLIPTGYILLGELPSWVKLVGVLLVVIGSLVMHRHLFAISLLEPIRAIVRERGSRYMLIVAFIFSLTNPIDAKLVKMSDSLTFSFAYGITIFLIFLGITIVRKADWKLVLKSVPLWIIIAGVMESIVNILQFTSHNYIDVVITISLKRAGIVLAVLMGWLVFKEKDITDKLIAASVMVAGALMFYLPMTITQSLILAAIALTGAGIALYLTRNSNTKIGPTELVLETETSSISPSALEP
jgi:drug/metabolite transporter (DMT)-like permease